MTQIAIIVGIIAIIAAVLRLFATDTTAAAGRQLQHNFSFGTYIGRSLTQIEKACGKPNEFEDLSDGNKKYTWSKDKYSISILFDKDNIAIKKLAEKTS